MGNCGASQTRAVLGCKIALSILVLSIGLSACGGADKQSKAPLTEEEIFNDLVSNSAFTDEEPNPKPVLLAIERFANNWERLERKKNSGTFVDIAAALGVGAAQALKELDSTSYCQKEEDPEDIMKRKYKICRLRTGPFQKIYLRSGLEDPLTSSVSVVYNRAIGGKKVEFTSGRLGIEEIEKPKDLPEQVIPPSPPLEDLRNNGRRGRPARV